MSANVCIVFPNQLFENSQLITAADTIYLVEEVLFFKQYNFHKQKIAFHRATMKKYESYLSAIHKKVIYINSFEENSDVRKLIRTLSNQKVCNIRIYNPVDKWLEKRIKKITVELKIGLTIDENPLVYT